MESAQAPHCRGSPEFMEVSMRRLVKMARYISGIAAVVVGAHLLAGSDTIPSVATQQMLNDWLVHGHLSLFQTREDMLQQADDDVLARYLSTSQSSSTQAASTQQSSGGGGCGGHHGFDHSLNSTFSFLLFCFLACSIIDHCNLYVPIAWRFPISVMMFFFGGLTGIVFVHVVGSSSEHRGRQFDDFLQGMEGAAYLDPHALLVIVLPPLLYESASAMEWHAIRKVLPSAVILALPGVLLNSFLTGGFVKVAFRIDGEAPNFETALLMGAILSATDPVAVVSALAALGAPKKLSSLVEGESLLNDGTAVVCFLLLKEQVSKDTPADQRSCSAPPEAGCIMGFFFKVAFGGAGLGVAFGLMLWIWIRIVRSLHMPVLEIAIILTAVYGAFFVAEALKTSGVLAVVTIGLMMSAGVTARLSHDGRHNHHVILAQIGYACNQVAFFSAGIVSARFFEGKNCDHTAMEGQGWAELAGLYFVIHVTRALVILCFSPILRRIGYGINWKEALILVYGGLRGAVGLILAMLIEHDEYMDPNAKQMIAFHTSGIVLLTLGINGSTIDGLYKRLDMYPPNKFRMTHMRKTYFKLEAECQHHGVKHISGNWFFKDCVFKKVIRCVPSFKHIVFDVAQAAVPDKIESVSSTLASLVLDAETHGAKLNAHSGSFQGDVNKAFRSRKQAEQTFTKVITSSQCDLTDLKDVLIGIKNTGDRQLDYKPQAKRAVTGFYVSSRPLSALREDKHDDEEFDHFSVRISRVDQVQVIIGFVTLVEDITHCDCQSQVLGRLAENSVGFNCWKGVLEVHGVEGHIVPDMPKPPLVNEGDVIRVVLFRPPTSDFEVRFEVIRQKRIIFWCATLFGPFTPDEVFPTVEFRCADESQMLKGSVTRTNTGFSGSEGDVSVPGSIGTAITDSVNAVGSTVVSSMSGAVSGASKVVAKSVDAVSGLVKRHPSGPSVADSDGRHSPRQTEKFSACARVDLNFEPQLSTAAESINELFHVLFNTVMTKYTDMHEHGILSDLALEWLTETVGVGFDCANDEVGALHAIDFRVDGHDLENQRRLSENQEAMKTSPESALTPGLTVVEGIDDSSRLKPKALEIAKTKTASLGTPSSPSSFMSKSRIQSTPRETVTRMKTVFDKLRLGGTRNNLIGVFEPLVVEYLALEDITSANSIYDWIPARFERLRLMGYNQTRAKVEALWAFVEAHEKFIKDCSVCVARFPDLVRCIHTIVGEAKKDLTILEEIQPRRFFYSKHLLLLRVVLTGRHSRLHKYVKEGWISEGDAAGFAEALWERIVEVDQYVPRLLRFRSPKSTSSSSSIDMMMKTPIDMSFSALNAWDDVDFDAFLAEHMQVTPVPDTPAGSSEQLATPARRKKVAKTWTCAELKGSAVELQQKSSDELDAAGREHVQFIMADECSQIEPIKKLPLLDAQAELHNATTQSMEMLLPGSARGDSTTPETQATAKPEEKVTDSVESSLSKEPEQAKKKKLKLSSSSLNLRRAQDLHTVSDPSIEPVAERVAGDTQDNPA